jgi:Gpi18-like mannosyltransferase
MVTYISYILFPVPAHFYPNTPVDIVGLFTSWNHWDAANFTYIAEFGYTRVELTAFFPLFPLLIKVIAYLIGNNGYIAIGMLLSNLALLGTMFVLYRIAADVLGDQVGRRALLYLCLFPTAFFFFAAYNESLFIFLTAQVVACRYPGFLCCLNALGWFIPRPSITLRNLEFKRKIGHFRWHQFAQTSRLIN